MIKRWGDSHDEEMSGLMLGGCEVSHAELQEIAVSPMGAIEAGVPADLVNEYQDAGGTFDEGDLWRWLIQRAEPAESGFILVHSYSRSQAIADGLLVDVTEQARETGFTLPVAVSRAVWSQYVEVPPKVSCQDERGRLNDLLWMLHVAIKQEAMESDTLTYQVLVRNDNRAPKPVWLKATVGPGDDPWPVLTILLPSED